MEKVQLDAQVFDVDSGQKLDDVTLVTISVGGVGFVSHLDDIKVGDEFRVRFYLDNDSQALVDEEVRVRNIIKGVIGTEFAQQDYYNFDLDFYLMPITVVD
ncbi:MAG: PilZ domain-containing protein [Candidatus Tectomicrobia bacterium]|nr:PilZ domain-containing protein [Candidatus Tectomicrobia bacterium]